MGPFVVEFYETRDGQRPAEDFLDELDIKMRSKLVMTLKVLQEQGNRLREPYSKHLDDGIFEIRGKVGTDISRVMYFFYYGGRIILTNGFIKKTQKTPKSEIERAKQYRKDFLEELDIKMRSKLVMTLKVLQEQGNRLREPYSKHLDDGIFEIRGKVGTDISRVMYFFYYGGRIILTNGFIKKTQKTPKSEIERAKQYRKDFLEREGESDENTGSVFE